MPQTIESEFEQILIPEAELCPNCCGTQEEPGFLTVEGLRRYCTSSFHTASVSAEEGNR
jgi:hypothetical protein